MSEVIIDHPQKVSIVIVSWNTRETTLAALRSLLATRGITHEILVVDNASEDGSADAVSREFPMVRLFRNDRNRGFAAGVNLGLREARYPLLLVINPDTVVREDSVEALATYARTHPEAGIFGPRVLNPDGTLQDSRISFPSEVNLLLQASYLYKLFPRSRMLNPEQIGGIAEAAAGRVDAVSGCCFLLRRTTLDKIGLLDDRYFMYFEEVDLCYRAWKLGVEVHYVPSSTIVHLGGASSKLASRSMHLEFRRSALRFFHEHYGTLRAQVARLLLLMFLLLRVPYWTLRAILPSAQRGLHVERLAAYARTTLFLVQPLSKILEIDRHDREA